MQQNTFISKKDIIDYYTTSQWLYRLFCYDSKSLGMHFGFWDSKTKNLQEAIINENKLVTDIANIQKGMKVLDAGCGVGGTSLYIAQHTKAYVWAISITPAQISIAQSYTKKRHLEELTNFSVQDFTKTNFPDNFFDAVVGIESICCASPKTTFLKEAYRILRPGGKLVIADGYLLRKPENKKETEIIDNFMWAFALNEFITPGEMTTQIKKSGFTRIETKDMYKEVKLSIMHYRRITNFFKYVCLVSKYIPIPRIQAMYKGYLAHISTADGYFRGLSGYYIHSATKPMHRN